MEVKQSETTANLSVALSKSREDINAFDPESADATELEANEKRMAAHKDLERRYRASIQKDMLTVEEEVHEDKPETRELDKLKAEIRVSNYLLAAIRSKPVEGREAELNQELDLSVHNTMPWEAIDFPREEVEERVDATTAAPTTGITTGTQVTMNQVLGRVFLRSPMSFLGTSYRMVSAGTPNFPVFTSGTTASYVSKGSEHDGTAAVFTPNSAEPRRLTASYLWTMEDEAIMGGMLESALRRDLQEAMAEEQAQDGIDQLLADSGGLAGPAAPPTVTVTYLTAIETLLKLVDGRYAQNLQEIRGVIGRDLWNLLETLRQTSDGDKQMYLGQELAQRGVRTMYSAMIPDTASNVERSIFRVGPDANLLQAVWQGIRLVLDSTSAVLVKRGRRQLVATALVSEPIALRKDTTVKRQDWKVS